MSNLELNQEIINAIEANPEIIVKLFESKKDEGYSFYTKGLYNVNNFGIRIKTTDVDFNDVIGTVYREVEGGPLKCKAFVGTTDPGIHYLKNPINKNGTAILVPGQYKGYELDFHRGQYLALCQRNGKVKVYRDGDRNDIIDIDAESLFEGYFGINIHKASESENRTDENKYGAGCQEIRSPKEYDTQWMPIQETAKEFWGNSFTYTLFELEDMAELLTSLKLGNKVVDEEE